MKLPIRNHTSQPLTLFIEPYCDQHEIAPGGEAIVFHGDEKAPILDIHPDNWIALWDVGETEAVVEVVSKEQVAVVDTLSFVTGFLFQFGAEGKVAAKDIENAVEREEELSGYVEARFAAYRAFREGYRIKQSQIDTAGAALPQWSGQETLVGAYRAGGVGAVFNRRVRLEPTLIDLGKPPFDTDYARLKFEEADALVQT
jgi:hypothetical protein